VTRPIRIIGSYISPYVRKVLVVLDLKGIAYEIDPIVPFFGNDEFSRLSPVRRIPVLVDGDVTLCDSTVICEYLEERYPQPPLLPRAIEDRARARWLEEYADTRMGEVFIWRLFNERVIGPYVWKRPTDDAVVRKALDVEIPEILDYLEPQLPQADFLFGPISITDVALATFFRNAAFAGFSIDRERWPVAARFVERTLEQPSFAKLRPFEDLSIRTPVVEQRAALLAAGAPIAAQTLGTATPRPGVLAT